MSGQAGRHRPLLHHRGTRPIRAGPRRRHPRRPGSGHQLCHGRLGHPRLRGPL